MSLRVQRDGADVVIRIEAGKETGGFARFLEGAATALEQGHIPPTNPQTTMTPAAAAEKVREIADSIHKVNA